MIRKTIILSLCGFVLLIITVFLLRRKNSSIAYEPYNLPVLLDPTEKETRVTEGSDLFKKSRCTSCHYLGALGSRLGSSLNHLRTSKNPGFTKAWIENPQRMRPGVRMPKAKLTNDELISLIYFLHEAN